jgi:uncharacterized protein
MSTGPQDGPLTWNVAGLLADSVGADRVHPVAGMDLDLGPDAHLARPIDGQVRLTRTNRGVLAHAALESALQGVCSRCVRDISIPIRLELDEEFLPSLDLATGKPLPMDDEPDAARLTDHHELDLETSVREAIWLAEPIAPLCRPDCPGLCVVCGGRLEEGEHDHPDVDIDPRLEALRAFREEDA